MTTLVLSDGVRLEYDDRGRGSPIVMLHGWGTSRKVFEGLSVDLCADFRVIAYDARGCGDSDHPADGHTIERAARDALEVIDHLGLGPSLLVGSSLGGNIALEAGLIAPELVAGLVLVDAPLHWFADGVPPSAIADLLHDLSFERPEVLERIVPNWFGPRVGAATHRWTVSMLMRSSYFIDDLVRDATNHDRREQMPEFHVPVVLIHGRDDAEIPLHVAEECATLIPDARLIAMEDCGHMPHLEDRRAFSGHLLDIARNILR